MNVTSLRIVAVAIVTATLALAGCQRTGDGTTSSPSGAASAARPGSGG